MVSMPLEPGDELRTYRLTSDAISSIGSLTGPIRCVTL